MFFGVRPIKGYSEKNCFEPRWQLNADSNVHITERCPINDQFSGKMSPKKSPEAPGARRAFPWRKHRHLADLRPFISVCTEVLTNNDDGDSVSWALQS